MLHKVLVQGGLLHITVLYIYVFNTECIIWKMRSRHHSEGYWILQAMLWSYIHLVLHYRWSTLWHTLGKSEAFKLPITFNPLIKWYCMNIIFVFLLHLHFVPFIHSTAIALQKFRDQDVRCWWMMGRVPASSIASIFLLHQSWPVIMYSLNSFLTGSKYLQPISYTLSLLVWSLWL